MLLVYIYIYVCTINSKINIYLVATTQWCLHVTSDATHTRFQPLRIYLHIITFGYVIMCM